MSATITLAPDVEAALRRQGSESLTEGLEEQANTILRNVLKGAGMGKTDSQHGVETAKCGSEMSPSDLKNLLAEIEVEEFLEKMRKSE
jgi:hypothetical protein